MLDPLSLTQTLPPEQLVVPLVRRSEHPDGKPMPKRSAQSTGPKGGDLNKPQDHPEWRNQDFAPIETLDGSLGLHRHKSVQEKAIPGQKNEQPWHRMAWPQDRHHRPRRLFQLSILQAGECGRGWDFDHG